MPLTFGYLLPEVTQNDIKARTLEVYNKAKEGSSSSTSKGSGKSSKVQSSEATAALNEVSDMFK
jgi:hypothetical protein